VLVVFAKAIDLIPLFAIPVDHFATRWAANLCCCFVTFVAVSLIVLPLSYQDNLGPLHDQVPRSGVLFSGFTTCEVGGWHARRYSDGRGNRQLRAVRYGTGWTGNGTTECCKSIWNPKQVPTPEAHWRPVSLALQTLR
jgi:hypothetical protein